MKKNERFGLNERGHWAPIMSLNLVEPWREGQKDTYMTPSLSNNSPPIFLIYIIYFLVFYLTLHCCILSSGQFLCLHFHSYTFLIAIRYMCVHVNCNCFVDDRAICLWSFNYLWLGSTLVVTMIRFVWLYKHDFLLLVYYYEMSRILN